MSGGIPHGTSGMLPARRLQSRVGHGSRQTMVLLRFTCVMLSGVTRMTLGRPSASR